MIKYKAGSQNWIADALNQCQLLVTAMQMRMHGFEAFCSLYPGDPDFCDMWRNCVSGSYKEFSTNEGYLLKGNHLCIPNISLRDAIILYSHTGGLTIHFGCDKTLALICFHFY